MAPAFEQEDPGAFAASETPPNAHSKNRAATVTKIFLILSTYRNCRKANRSVLSKVFDFNVAFFRATYLDPQAPVMIG